MNDWETFCLIIGIQIVLAYAVFIPSFWKEYKNSIKLKNNNMNETLIQLQTKLEFYKKLDKKIHKLINSELTINEWLIEVGAKILMIEKEINDLMS